MRELSIGATEATEVWRWTAAKAADLPAEWHTLLAHMDDCKPVDGGKAIIATSSLGGTVLIERASGRVLFHAYTPNAHSADLLPGGLIAIALSVNDQGNRLQIYRRTTSEAVLAEMPLFSGHGVVWDGSRHLLFVLSRDLLQALTVDDQGKAVRLGVKEQWPLPGHRDGHELSARGDGSYFVTTADGVWVFDPDAGSFTPYTPLNPATTIKAVSQSGGMIAWQKPEESWWAHGFWVGRVGEATGRRYPIDKLALYKIRWTQ